MNWIPSTPLLIGLLGSVVLLTVWGLWRSRTLAHPAAKIAVFLLRLAALAVVGFVLTNPTLLIPQTHAVPRDRVAVLVDRSESMFGARTRLADDLVRTLRDSPLLAGHADYARCGSRVAPLAEGGQPDGPTDQESRLCEALIQATADARTLGAVVLVSDGRASDADRLGATLKRLVDAGVPVCAVPATAPVASGANLRITALRHDDDVRPGEEVVLTASFSASDASVKEGAVRAVDASGKELLRAPVVFKDRVATVKLPMRMPEEAGTVTLEILPLPGEFYLDDNRVDFELHPRRDKIRVLYMEGSTMTLPYPTTGRQTPVQLFMPRAWQAGGIEVDLYSVQDQTSDERNLFRVADGRRGFCPTREELQSFDVVICSDIKRVNFSDEQLEWVRAWVEKQGGGFMMIGGDTSFGDGGWHRTVWEKLVPFTMSGYDDASRDAGPFLLRFAPGAFEHPVLQVEDDPVRNRHILAQGISLTGTNMVNRLKPGATALAWHSHYEDMPVLAVQSYGRGRTMGFTSDSAGGWGSRMMTSWGPNNSGNAYYNRLWVNAVRWLAENHFKSGVVPAELIPSTLNLDGGESCRFAVRLAALAPEQVAAVELDLGDGRKILMDRSGPLWVADAVPEAAVSGEVKAVAALLDAKGHALGEAQCLLHVRKVSGEWRDPTPDLRFMAQVAKASGGKVCLNPEEARHFVEERLGRSAQVAGKPFEVPQWDLWWLLALLLALLAGEWALRRWQGVGD